MAAARSCTPVNDGETSHKSNRVAWGRGGKNANKVTLARGHCHKGRGKATDVTECWNFTKNINVISFRKLDIFDATERRH